jgi:hypothetical protein
MGLAAWAPAGDAWVAATAAVPARNAARDDLTREPLLRALRQ